MFLYLQLAHRSSTGLEPERQGKHLRSQINLQLPSERSQMRWIKPLTALPAQRRKQSEMG
jgi:hypothetical protein